MTRARLIIGLLAGLAAAALLAAGAAWLALHPPRLAATSVGGFDCPNPVETVLGSTDAAPPAGAADADSIVARCHDTSKNRFMIAVPLGAAAVALAGLTIVMTIRRRE